MPGADRDGLTAGPADRLQAVGGAIVALDSGLGHMSENPASHTTAAFCAYELDTKKEGGARSPSFKLVYIPVTCLPVRSP